MRIGPFSLRLVLIPPLVAMLALLVGLGFWQLDRAEQKQARLAALAAAREARPVDITAGAPGSEALFRPARLRGRYDAAHQFLLDNQVRNGRVGYRVLTPLRVAAAAPAVLVDRGWVPAAADRAQLPEIPAPGGSVAPQGLVYGGPSVGLRLGPPAASGDWPRRLQYLDFGYVAEVLGYPIRDYVLRLDPDAPGGYARDWPQPALGPERHLGYAVQWFSLAAALLVLAGVVAWRRGGRA